MYGGLKLRRVLFILAALVLMAGAWGAYYMSNCDDYYHEQADKLIYQNPNYEVSLAIPADQNSGYIDNKAYVRYFYNLSENHDAIEAFGFLSDTYQAEVTNSYYIHIDLDDKKLYLYNKGMLVKSYPVSGGKSSSPSPQGKWTIINKAGWGEGFGGAWLGINVPWGKYGIHGTKSPWFLGKANVSKGCIRMNNEDVRELFRLVPHGTIITIVQKNAPFRAMKSGDFGSDVRDIQVKLKEKGFYKGHVSGVFSDDLKNAVIRFQKSSRIHESGIVYRTTFDKIME